VIYKSGNSQTSVARPLTPDSRAELEIVRGCPLLLQELIVGPDVRLHLVGERAFAERIDFAGGEDARHGPRALRKFTATSILSEVLERCRAFARDNGLWLVGFDFKLDQETGEFVDLEANPMPAFEGYDFRSGRQISAALLELLHR
jgi:hypothetical protein